MGADETASSFGQALGRHLRNRSEEITRTWLAKLSQRLAEVEARRIFPEETLLNHLPEILQRLASFVEATEANLVAEFVVEDLRTLAKLRRRQGYGLEEIHNEFAILGHLLHDAARAVANDHQLDMTPEVVDVFERLHGALRQISISTALGFTEAAQKDRLDRAQTLDRFGKVVSHELRNRLQLARLSLEAWRQEKEVAANEDKQLHRALEGVFTRLESLSDDVLTLVVAQGSQETAWQRRRPLDQVIEDVLEASQSMAKDRNVEVGIEGDLPDVAADAARVEFALVNLMVHAIRYSDLNKDSPRVVLWAKRQSEEPSGWIVAVEDNGKGVSDDLRKRIFEDSTRGVSQVPGSGMGLAITRQVVEQMGGRLWLESEVGKGSTFFVLVPDPPSE